MLSIGATRGAGQGEYYINLAREDYYIEGGEPPGEWYGDGAKQLGLRGEVEGEEFSNILLGFSGDGENKLVQNAGKEDRASGWDLTFSAPKSVSVLWSQAEEEIRREVQEAHRAAVKGALGYLEGNAAYTRVGHGGYEREEAGIVVATFEHGTSRAQDPQLHTHALVVNLGVRDNGETGTVEGREFYRHKMAAGALYRAELAKELGARLGLKAERKKSWFELQGVSKDLVTEFSTRRQEIERQLRGLGFDSAKAAEVAALDTRVVKESIPRDELFDQWQGVGREMGWGSEEVGALVGEAQAERQERSVEDIESEKEDATERAVEKITSHASHFPERDLVRFIAEEAQGRGLGIAEVISAAKEHLGRSQEIVAVGKVKGELHYTTKEMLDVEKEMLRKVKHLEEKSEHIVSDEVVSSLIEKQRRVLEDRGEGLSVEQEKAVRHITEEAGGVKVVSGMAGAGKTTMLGVAGKAWRQGGYEVIGAALAGKAAGKLEEETGIKSYTIHKTLKDIESRNSGSYGIELGEKTIVVIDEAGMVGTRMMGRLVDVVAEAGGKLVLVGDEKQLQSVEAGGPFQAIAKRVGQRELKEIRRQREPWARGAVHSFANGEAKNALEEYAKRGLLRVSEDRNEAMKELVEDWKKDGSADPEEHLILAAENVAAVELNRQAQAERYRDGELGEENIRVNSERFYINDRILFTRNSYLYGVRNGNLGTIEGVDGEEIRARLDSGEEVNIDINEYDHVKLGYAVTTHKSQGVTVENSYILAGGMMQDRELSYVQASRARGETRIYVDKIEAGEEVADLARAMANSRQKDLAIDVLEAQKQERENRIAV